MAGNGLMVRGTALVLADPEVDSDIDDPVAWIEAHRQSSPSCVAPTL